MEYTPKIRFWLVIVPIFLAIVITSYLLYNVGTAVQLSIFGRTGEKFGTLAAWGLAFVILFAAANVLIRKFGVIRSSLGAHGEKMKDEHQSWLIQHKQLFVDIHLTVGIIGFLGALIHAYILWKFVNIWLILSIALFGWIVVVGLILKLGGVPPKARRYAYLMHSQWITVVVLIVVTLIGHATLGHIRLN